PGTTQIPEGTLIQLGNRVTDATLAGPLNYTWSVNGPGVTTSVTTTSDNYTFRALDEGTYLVGLQVTDSNSRTGTATPVTVQVVDATPSAALTRQNNQPAPAAGTAGMPITLKGGAADGGAIHDYQDTWTAAEVGGK